MLITYYDDYEGTIKSVPLAEAPDVFVNPSATPEDISEWHYQRRADRLEMTDALDRLEL